MNRRRFLSIFAAFATAYSLPPIGGWKSDLIAHPDDSITTLGIEYSNHLRCFYATLEYEMAGTFEAPAHAKILPVTTGLKVGYGHSIPQIPPEMSVEREAE